MQPSLPNSVPPRHARQGKLPLALFAALLALYIVLGLALPNAPLQDFPNHLTRARIIADLLFDHGALFGHSFAVHLALVPYLGGDLALAALAQLTGTEWASRLWIALSLALLPLGVCFAARKEGADWLAASTASILALYVATNLFFVMGLTNYQLGMACSFFAYGYFREAAKEGRLASYVGFAALLLISYLLHLATLVFILAIMGIVLAFSLLHGKVSLKRAALLLLLPALLLIWQLLHSGTAAAYAYEWGGWLSKLIRSGFVGRRFERAPDYALYAVFLLLVVVPLLARRLRLPILIASERSWVIAVLFGMYVLMPLRAGGAYAIDVRALPYALLFLVLASVRAASLAPALRGPQLALAAVLALVNLGYVAPHLLSLNTAMGTYRSVAARAPRDSMVLPIDTDTSVRATIPFLHAGSFATLTAAAVTPYLFAADDNPHIGYFRYVDRPYAPPPMWYMKGSSGDKLVDWARVLRQYQFLLITAPWDPHRIPVQYTVVASNDAAALLKLPAPRAQ